jgi:hypothetical protein
MAVSTQWCQIGPGVHDFPANLGNRSNVVNLDIRASKILAIERVEVELAHLAFAAVNLKGCVSVLLASLVDGVKPLPLGPLTSLAGRLAATARSSSLVLPPGSPFGLPLFPLEIMP